MKKTTVVVLSVLTGALAGVLRKSVSLIEPDSVRGAPSPALSTAREVSPSPSPSPVREGGGSDQSAARDGACAS